MTDFIAFFKVKAQQYAEHHFVAQWQNAQKVRLVDNLPERHRLVYIDFAANLVHQCQNEVQAQEYAKMQSTVLVIMVGQRKAGKTTFVTHSYCSADREHAFLFVIAEIQDLCGSMDENS